MRRKRSDGDRGRGASGATEASDADPDDSAPGVDGDTDCDESLGMLDLPLVLYFRFPGASGGAEVEGAEALARQAAVTVAKAATLSAARSALAHLEDGVATRGLIGQAHGLLMARHGCRGQEAFEMLRQAQVSNRKLHSVAAEIVAEHERGASARVQGERGRRFGTFGPSPDNGVGGG